jgi:DNA-3-methyladenine glycosylase I
MAEPTRCAWPGTDPLYIAYHDHEWGVPEHDDRALLEKLILDGAQAGLAWITILRKRDHCRLAFDGFDPERIARYDEARIQDLLADPGIVRNRLKIEAAIANARAFLALRESGESFNDFLWQFVGFRTIQNHWREQSLLPAATPESERMSRELRRRGFRFVGPTICYAFMQAVGMVNDHVISCFRHQQLAASPNWHDS